MGARGNWTPERVETLKKMKADGRSASEIARALGGVSRNAIIGKMARMGLLGQGKPRKPKDYSKPSLDSKCEPAKPGSRKPKAKLIARAVTPRKPIPAPKLASVSPRLKDKPAAAQPKGLRLEELSDNQCRFPLRQVADGSAQRFCGSRALAGKPYCGHHHALTTGVGTASERRATKLSGPGLRRGDRRVLNVTKRIGR